MHSMRYVQAATRPPGRVERSRGKPRPAREITSEVRRQERRRYRRQ